MVEEFDVMDCSNPSGKNKGAEFVCKIGRIMQDKDNQVSFSEMEDGMVAIKVLDKQITDVADLKAVLRPALAKNIKAEKAFDAAFDQVVMDLFPKKRASREKDVTGKLGS